MILFKITACPDKNQIGVYQHESNELTIGSADADMVIDDPALSPKQVEIKYIKGQFGVVNLNKKVSVRLNGAEVPTKPTPIKSNDSLSMGETTIFFTQINDKPLAPPQKYVNEAAAARLNREGSNENSLLRALQHLAGDGKTPPKR